ncbi:signal transduction histidine kinase, nitrogen specific [Desulfosporosinus acidiphilus SJ4]|uniref:histidine kinase n=1 Tax=Desulfosporosinus acidiphilus (strain DSM 22704 / JCM 16185 / SJ4) TaxID=646529 RepID=I4D263_DESAJ|nr:ATP-binding protein [Desulfosporosinus acidiphilus]AFM39887.1 signal transduction histidine kinase, nitrogen specific [Desulfosporosinus acidiphilus SJ4]
MLDLLNSLPGIVIVVEENYKVRFANRNYNREFGEDHVEFCYNMFGRTTPCENCKINEVFVEGRPMENEDTFYNGEIYEAKYQPFRDIDGTRLVIKTLYNITERKKGEQELSRLHREMAHLERLNLVAQMAAGITHEIRNPISVVRGYLQFLGSKPEFQLQGQIFELMINELDRANSIISDYLAISRNSTKGLQYFNINKILRHLYPLLEADSGSQDKQIEFNTRETPNTMLNPDEISQLVLNLCRNSLEAMKAGGTLTIQTYVENEFVILCIEDEGGGIPTEQLDRIGTPFFTTKENGTGLGLSICYDIAFRHNASIDFKSSPRGTTFFVRFPLVKEVTSLSH